MERSYGKFAQLYDKLTFDVPYKKYADFIELMIKEHGISAELVFDLACGTGTLAGELSSRGYDMIASDASGEMLGKAIEKYGQGKILFLNQPMQDFELFGTVDVIICMLDSINYLTEKEDLDKAIALCANYLNDGGLLIFDVNSEYKFKNILGDNTYTYEMEDVFYVWENNYNDKEKICDFFLTFFVENENGLYERIDEHHIQRCYSDDEIHELLLNNGFSITGVYDGYSKKPVESDSQRILYSAVRRR
ncbi:MAG: class I SAM-dependent methyltransferase [Ruminococcaceae bacterium]|nr:class I SAM-dependent methyltransferase [Oscillospiraceae bacterium]